MMNYLLFLLKVKGGVIHYYSIKSIIIQLFTGRKKQLIKVLLTEEDHDGRGVSRGRLTTILKEVLRALRVYLRADSTRHDE